MTTSSSKKPKALAHQCGNREQMNALNRKICCVDGCKKKATTIVFDRPRLLLVKTCDEHIHTIAENDGPEYIVSCPACGCEFGVN